MVLCRVAAWIVGLAGLLAGATVHAQSSSRFAPVATLVRAREDTAALRWLGAQPFRDEPDARYLRGRLLERTGRARDAADVLDIEDGLPEPVAAELPVRRGLALARAGQCGEAIPLLSARGYEGEGRPRAGALGATARAVHAECLAVRGPPAEAAQALERVIREDARGVDTAAARLSLASVYRRMGRLGAARDELHGLLTSRPEHPAAAAAVAALDALGAPFRPSAEQRLERAARFRTLRMPQEALSELAALGRPQTPRLRDRWLHEKGMALFQTRHDYPEAARVLRGVSRRAPTIEEDAFHAARAMARAGQNPAAIRAFRAFERRHRRHRRAAEAAYLAAWLDLRRGRSGSMTRFRRGRHAKRSPRFARNAEWHLAFHAFEARRYRNAAEGFERYAGLGNGPLVAGRGTYWLGRARTLARDRAGAAEAFVKVIEEAPLHWYALLARQRLEELGREVPPPVAPDPDANVEVTIPSPAALPAHVAFLHELGLDGDAARALRAVEADMRSSAPKPWGLRNLAVAYGAIGHATRVYRLVASEARSLRYAPTPATRWLWNAAYPRAFEPVVGRAAAREGIAPEYLWAIMRQESGYDPDAVSYADAIGLLQLLPRTARLVAEELSLPFARRRLFEPAFNARIAARYNADLKRQLGVPLSIAAYNAGEHRILRWLEEDANTEPMDLDRFVERIPIDQTRNYVRRVTSHLAHYLYLRSTDGGWPDLTLPAQVSLSTLPEPATDR